MTSREEFMRQMGLTSSDLRQPPPEPSTRSKKTFVEEPKAKAPSGQTNRVEAVDEASSRKPLDQSKLDFLRAMGIDNYHDAPAAKNATGSQEFPKADFARQPPASGTFARSKALTEDEDESTFRGSYTPKLREAQREDLTLGRKGPSERAPSTPALDLELLGLSRGAGVEEVKNLGNKFFQAGDYRKAVRLYTQAAEMDGMNAAIFSNRSAAYLLGSKQMGIDTRSMALRDADKAIKLKPTWFKGYSRRGDALFKLERYDEAFAAYEQALELDPGNAGIIHSMTELKPFIKSKPTSEKMSWSAPGNAVLHSSVASQGATLSNGKSAHEMLYEFQQERARTTPQLGTGGVEYKSRELERFRQRSSTNDSTGDPEEHLTMETPKPKMTPINRRDVPSEFSSDAARDYQAQLLDSYRKKKAQMRA